jgi:hypothetical protein
MSEVEHMLYEDKTGKLYMPDEIEELSLWEIDELGIHVFESSEV